MNKNCEIVQDLLPLYCDGVCSEASTEMVKKHLLECKDCQQMLGNLQNGTAITLLKGETDEIISHHNQAIKKKTLSISIVIAAVLAVPILVSFIVNLSTGKTLDWFFIVLTSLLVVASVSIVPLIVETRKAFWTIISFTASTLLLLLTTSIFSNGDWFFMASVSFLLGISVLFMPVILKQLPVKKDLLNNRIAVISMLMDTLFVYSTVITANIYTNAIAYLPTALLITSSCLLPVWLAFFIIRYTKLHALSKAGIVAIIIGLPAVFTNDIIEWISGKGYILEIGNANLSSWNESNTDANIKMIIFLAFTIIGILLWVIGSILNKKKRP